MSGVPVTRSQVRLLPDPTRRIVMPYLPADLGPPGPGPGRTERMIQRVLSLSPQDLRTALRDLYERFADTYPDLDEVFLSGFSTVEKWVPATTVVGDEQRRLIGAYFLHEYTLEGAALTNPSIVAAPDQAGLADGYLRVVISLRAVGEGHISSIEFRIGVVGPTGDIEVASPAAPVAGTRQTPLFERAIFLAKLDELGANPGVVKRVLGSLDDHFTMDSLETALAPAGAIRVPTPAVQRVRHLAHWLASSNYEVVFSPDLDLSQRILTPNGPTESHGIEDARFVRFVESDGSVIYYCTYTAFDGFSVLPQLIETTDFETFRVCTLNGSAAINKGIALFPRRVGGRYAALGRSDGESNYLMVSDHVRFWHHADLIQVPARPWELLQIGNAGTPIETEAGWLVITHGVGPLRQYALGAILLDIDEPRRVIGHLPEPLLLPERDERDGYVPNVVYSCGSLVHEGHLIIAYGASDTFATFASVPVDALLAALTSP